MKITKHNIEQIISNYIKSQNIRFDISEKDSRGCLYELHISSTEGYIQVEYNLDDDNDDYFCLQFFTSVDSNGLSLYHSDWDNESSGDSIEDEIEELLNSIKRINQGLNKIQIKIEQIKDICEEYNLDFDELIDVLYDFEK